MFIRSILAAVVTSTAALPALAQQSCAPRGLIIEQLEARFEEAQTGAGLQSETRLVEVWSSKQGSWTILVTDVNGVSCVIASGSHWRTMEPAVELSGIPS